MGVVAAEFDRHLAELARRHAGRPRREMEELLFLALEREELVSVAYADGLLGQRIARMPVDEDVRAILRQALAWTWKDEEMHAVWVRGVLLRLGRLRFRLHAHRRWAEGAVGGWTSFVLQHLSWREAPVSRLVAVVVAALGGAAGKVPAAVRDRLTHGSFRAFCEFNVDAEATAAACWRRLVELAGVVPDAGALRVEFERMAADEHRHRRAFAALAEALDEHDRLRAGRDAAGLARELAGIDEPFVPRAWRRQELARHPLGSGGLVVVRRSPEGESPADALRRVLADAGLAATLEARAKELGRPVPSLRVVVKPAFMLASGGHDVAHVTSPALVDALVALLAESGCAARVVEARNIYDRFFGGRDVASVARAIGLKAPAQDLSEDQEPHAFARGMHQATISAAWRDADVRIVFGKLRSHPIDAVYLTVGTAEGVGGRWEEFLFADRRLDRQAALMMLLAELPPHFAILDAHDSASDGLLGMMGCRRPPRPRRLYAAADALALDLVAARHAGASLDQCAQLRTACTWFGDPRPATRVAGDDAPIPGWRGPRRTLASSALCRLAGPAYTHGSGRGTLFVPAMDERAFPPLGSPGAALRVARAACRRLLGLPGAP